MLVYLNSINLNFIYTDVYIPYKLWTPSKLEKLFSEDEHKEFN